MKDVLDTRTSLLPGEYAIYNCTDPAKPLSQVGAFFSLECRDGEVTAPAVWPVCRELAG